MSAPPSKPDSFKQIVYGIAAAASMSYFGWLGVAILDVGDKFDTVNDRLTKIEVTIIENRAERQEQVSDLRRRVGNLEDESRFRLRRNGGQ